MIILIPIIWSVDTGISILCIFVNILELLFLFGRHLIKILNSKVSLTGLVAWLYTRWNWIEYTHVYVYVRTLTYLALKCLFGKLNDISVITSWWIYSFFINSLRQLRKVHFLFRIFFDEHKILFFFFFLPFLMSRLVQFLSVLFAFLFKIFFNIRENSSVQHHYIFFFCCSYIYIISFF